ncbi:hypothetical protein MXB_4062 [Myxobolus squamalis]|nr:hypothetical protein MXB_4062 [Myxobolus squamalis]
MCVVNLTPTNIRFITQDSLVRGSAFFWCSVKQVVYESVCDEYRLEGKGERNEIYLELVSEHISRIFKSACKAQQIKIKLVKIGSPFLCFELLFPSLTSNPRQVIHHVPVLILASSSWEKYQEPTNRPDLSLTLNDVKALRIVSERLKNVSEYAVSFLQLNA